MSTSTAKLQLHKPDPTEKVNVDQDLNANWDKLDNDTGFFVCTSATRPASPYQGQQIYETDTKWIRFWTGSKWFDISERAVRKPSSETVNNSTTLQNDDHLVLAMDANAEYLFDMFIRYRAATIADIKMQFTGPSGYSLFAAINKLSASASDEGADRLEEFFTGDNVVLGGIGATPMVAAHWSGTVKTGATAGNLQMQWAQSVADATNTQIVEGSYIKLKQIT